MAKNIELARVFVLLEAETKGLDGQLQQAERSLGRTADFIRNNPMAAAGALGAAFLAVGLKATAMAGEVDAAMRDVANSVPGATERLDDLKRTARELSDEFGIAQTEISGQMKALARTGIDSTDDLIAATRASVLAQKASGESFEAVNAALDASLDAFGLSARDSNTILAQLLATAKGQTNLADLGEALNRVGPRAAAAGLSFAETAAALAKIQGQGGSAKDQMGAFTTLLEKEGAAGVRSFTGAVVPAAVALEQMRTAADANLGTLGSLEDQLKTRLANVLIEFGEKVLPIAIQGFELLNEILGHFSGTTKQVAAEGSVDALVKQIDSLKPAQVAARKQSLDDLAKAMQDLAGGPSGALRDAFASIASGVKSNLGEIAPANLERLRDGLAKSVEAGSLTEYQLDQVRATLVRLNQEIAKRGGRPVVEAPPAETQKVKSLLAALDDYKKGQDGAGKAIKAREAIAKAALESELALVGAQAAEYIKVTEELHAKLTDLRGQDRANAEAQIKQVTDNLLLKWAGFKDAVASVSLVPAFSRTNQENLDKATAGVETLRLEVRDFAEILAVHGLQLDDTGRKTLEHRAKQETLRLTIKDVAGEFAFASAAIFGIAEDFGLADDKLKAIATSIGGIASAVGAFASGDAVGGTLAGLSAVAGLLKGVLGESPAAARARAILEKNSQVIAENTRAVLSNTPGAVFAGAGSFLGGLFGDGGTGLDFATVSGGRPRVTPDQIRAYLVTQLGKRGIKFSDFEQLAKDLGISLDLSSFDGANATLRQFFDRLGQSSVTGFGTSFADQLSRIRTGISIGAIRPEDELNEILGAAGGLTKKPTAFLSAFAGLDLSNDVDKEKAVGRLRDLFKNLPNLSAGDLGDLTRDEFVDLITQAIGILTSGRPLSGSGIDFGGSGLGGLGERDVLGDPRTKGGPTIPPPMDPALSSLADLTVEGNDYLAGILETLQSFQPIVPPSLQGLAGSGSGGGGLTITGPISLAVNLPPGSTPTDPSVVQQLADALFEEIDQRLGRRFLERSQASGYGRA